MSSARDRTTPPRAAERFSVLLESAPDAMLIADAGGRIVEVNRQAEELFGYRREELCGELIELLIPERFRSEHASLRRGYFRAPARRPLAATPKLRGRRKDGEEFPAEISLSPLTSDDGPQVIAAIRDVSQRAEEDALRARLAAIVEASSEAIMSLTPGGVIETWNESASGLYGYSAEEAIGEHAPTLLACDPERREALRVSTIGTGQSAHTESQDVSKDGRVIDVSVTWSPMLDGDGEAVGIARISRDITERKRTERKLAEAARFFELTNDMVCTASVDGYFQQLNERWTYRLGWSLDELRSAPFIEFVHPEDAEDTAKEVEGLHSGGVLIQFLNRYATKDGDWRWLEWNATGVPEERLIYASARDVTERVQAETMMREAEATAEAARDQALQASAMKSSFLANVSHEIRTPLNGVIGMADLLLDSPLNDEQRENARLLKGAGETLVAVVDDILDFSKIEARALRLEYVDFDLLEAVEDACDLVAERAREKNLELTVDIASDLPEAVRGDAVRLRQVISNLLGNAVKFTSTGEISITVRTVPAAGGINRVRFEIADSGIGISEQRLSDLWQPFTQADNSTTRRFGGTGLGLAIVKQLVEMMDGEVGAQSVPGRGSRFWCEIPFEPGTPVKLDVDDAVSLAGVKLLVVDDSTTNRHQLVALAKRWQMHVTAVDSAEAALTELRRAAARHEPYRCTALDMQLPAGDGLELAQNILREKTVPPPALVVLASTPDQRREIRDAGFDVFLTKPLRRRRLKNALLEALGIQTQRRGDPAGPRAARTALESPTILVAEDNEVNQILAIRMLERRGYRAQIAVDGRQALDALARAPYAAVLMDCQMPELSGYDATTQLRALEGAGRHTPVIAMTAHALRGDREKCLQSGMDDYLAKPLRPDELNRALARWAPKAANDSDDPQAALVHATPEAPAPSDGALDPDGLERLRSEFGSTGVLGRLVELYKTQTPDLLNALRNAIEAGDVSAVADHAHKLKGGSLTLAANPTAELCKELEARAKTGSLDGAQQLVTEIEGAFAEALAALKLELLPTS